MNCELSDVMQLDQTVKLLRHIGNSTVVIFKQVNNATIRIHTQL